MMRHPNSYGETELANIIVEKILDRLDLSLEDREIFVLRFGHNWYYNEIGEHVGNKYRGVAYSEGTMRHRVRGIREKLGEVIEDLV
jgi:DNA-directed RNA polymerase specialized sigma24 family protein